MKYINKLIKLFSKPEGRIVFNPPVKSEDIFPGDVWEYYCGDPNDPFRTGVRIQYNVLDVKDGYVLYNHVEFSGGSNDSTTIEHFMHGTKLVSRKKNEEKTKT